MMKTEHLVYHYNFEMPSLLEAINYIEEKTAYKVTSFGYSELESCVVRKFSELMGD
jgi:hypothetical protein